MEPTIVWLRNDLRLSDNQALYEASKINQPLILIYIDDSQEHDQPLGNYQKNWLHLSLENLSHELHEDGHRLFLFKGNAKKILKQIIEKTNAKTIFWNRCYEPKLIERDKEIKKEFKEKGLDVQSFPGFLLFEPWTVLNNQKEYFKVFTPYWKHCLKLLDIQKPLSKAKFNSAKVSLDSLQLNQLKLYSEKNASVCESWSIGEKEAMKRLKHFLSHGLAYYSQGRDFPALDATSKLSPNLHFGEISPRQVVYETTKYVEEHPKLKEEMNKFLSEIGWREFSYNLLYHFPMLPKNPFKPQYSSFPWKKSEKNLTAWQEGKTGIPIIDAGMRQLIQTGWMHNRVRMIVASFLIKNLRIHWHEGANWFWDHLLDADLASNSASWQWVFGSGADAAPYFRVFNPLLQSEKFDPKGEYIKHYVPELANLDPPFLHDPSNCPEDILRKAGITIGKTYPKILCDLAETRDEVLEAYKQIQEGKK